MEWTYFPDTMDAVRLLKTKGYFVIAVEQAEEALRLDAYVPREGQKVALVFGNEVKGVQQQVVDACDACIEIPQYGTKHSLNVSVSVGVVLWHFVLRLRG